MKIIEADKDTLKRIHREPAGDMPLIGTAAEVHIGVHRDYGTVVTLTNADGSGRIVAIDHNELDN
jgi:hypothetical protein